MKRVNRCSSSTRFVEDLIEHFNIYLYPSICMSIYLYICPSIYPSISIYFYLSFYLHILSFFHDGFFQEIPERARWASSIRTHRPLLTKRCPKQGQALMRLGTWRCWPEVKLKPMENRRLWNKLQAQVAHLMRLMRGDKTKSKKN